MAADDADGQAPGSCPVEATGDAAAEQTESGLNRDKRFGQNSYHYWHDHGKERRALGDVAPMPQPKLVGTEVQPALAKRKKRTLDKYSWGDGKKFVTIYCDYPGIAEKEDAVDVKFGKSSVRLCVKEEKEDVVLELVRLNGRIVGDESSLKFKPDQLVIKLKKDEERTWYDLKKTTATGGDSDSE